MTWSTDFLAGIAQVLEDDDVALWQPTGSYPAAPTKPVVYMIGLADAPDQAIALALYDVDSTIHGHGVQGLQVRCRGTKDPRVAEAIADAVFDSLHAREDLTLPRDGQLDIHVAQLRRVSHSPMGVDANRRWETASNYYALTSRASTHALP